MKHTGELCTSLAAQRFAVVAALTLIATFSTPSNGQAERDPHRPACSDLHCEQIKSFLKAHYCGESPYGNGPEDGCEIRRPNPPGKSVKVTADFDCNWGETNQKPNCKQRGQPTSQVRDMVGREMRKLGVPSKEGRQTYFVVWEEPSSGRSFVEARYTRSWKEKLMFCKLIAIIDGKSYVRVLRKVKLQMIDPDVRALTEWSLLDLADVNGDGHFEVILEADDYENHWLEVVSLQDGDTRTIFSGLGYYL